MTPFQYVVLRYVPRVDRQEFVNVAVVVYAQGEDFLQIRWSTDRADRLDPDADTDSLARALEFAAAVCAGEPAAGLAGQAPLGQRFGFLTAPRSTVVQPCGVHGGITADPSAELDSLFERFVA